LVSSLPDFKQVVKTNVFVGKFIDQTFHVAESVRARSPLEIYLKPPGKAHPSVKNHWFIVSYKHNGVTQ